MMWLAVHAETSSTTIVVKTTSRQVSTTAAADTSAVVSPFNNIYWEQRVEEKEEWG